VKKKIAITYSLALLVACGTMFAANQLHANEPHLIEKQYAQNTLEALGIDTDTDSIKSSHSVKDRITFTDDNGKEWIYIDYSDRTEFIEDMENYFDGGFVESFIGVQSKIMRKYSQVGDRIPVILLDEDLQAGTFSFTRDSGETLSFPIQEERTKGWIYKEPEVYESAR